MTRTVRLIVTCCLGFTGCVHINQGSRPMGSILSQSDLPKPGDWCRVTSPEMSDGKDHRSQGTVVGRVKSIDEHGIHLSDTIREGRRSSATPILSDLPVVGRRFRNTGVGREAVGSCTVTNDEIAGLEIISENEAQEWTRPLASSNHNVAQQLVAAVPGRR